jgi:hypothetical protein
MTKYIANENGDWWEYIEDSVLFVIDDTEGHISKAMLEEDSSPDGDKFEKFIWKYGKAVEIKEVIA